MGTVAAFYICDGFQTRFLREAEASAASVRKHLGIPCILFTGRAPERSIFDDVFVAPLQGGPWFLRSTRRHVEAVRQLQAYDRLLYLDTDTCIIYPCLDLFDVLDEYDFAICQSPGREGTPSIYNVPPAFSTLEVGVQVFRNNERVRAMLARWLELYEANVGLYGDNDQGALRDVLWSEKDVRWLTLPPEYGFRFTFGGWLYGPVRILHGRGDATGINDSHAMRIWNA